VASHGGARAPAADGVLRHLLAINISVGARRARLRCGWWGRSVRPPPRPRPSRAGGPGIREPRRVWPPPYSSCAGEAGRCRLAPCSDRAVNRGTSSRRGRYERRQWTPSDLSTTSSWSSPIPKAPAAPCDGCWTWSTGPRAHPRPGRPPEGAGRIGDGAGAHRRRRGTANSTSPSSRAPPPASSTASTSRRRLP
jgi:hypothetical protein